MKPTAARTRISLKNILYATDFSPVAEAAAPYAVELARRYDSKITAVHIRSLYAYGLAPAEVWPTIAEASERQTKEQAEHLKSLLRGVEHNLVIGEGDMWGVISALIEENDVDMIVLGTHGRQGLEKLVMGSVAEKILRKSPVPVLTVGPHVQIEPDAATAMKRILYATSFSPASYKAAAYAISLAEENQAKLDLLHVIEPQKAGELVHPHELVRGNLERLRQVVTPEEAQWCEPIFIVEQGDPAEQILSVAKQQQADIIVLGVKNAERDLGASTHLPWAVAHKVIAAATCPVLTVRG